MEGFWSNSNGQLDSDCRFHLIWSFNFIWKIQLIQSDISIWRAGVNWCNFLNWFCKKGFCPLGCTKQLTHVNCNELFQDLFHKNYYNQAKIPSLISTHLILASSFFSFLTYSKKLFLEVLSIYQSLSRHSCRAGHSVTDPMVWPFLQRLLSECHGCKSNAVL